MRRTAEAVTAQPMQTGLDMRLLHVADIHLGASHSAFGALAGGRARDVLDAFRRLPDTALEHRADAVLIAGDLFDGPQPQPEVLAAVRETLRRFIDACIPVFMVPGNHDAMTLKLNPYHELARAARVVMDEDRREPGREWAVQDEEGQRLAQKHRAYILARPEFGQPVSVDTEHGPLHVYGISYDAAESREPLSTFRRAEMDGVHVVLLHAAIHDAAHWQSSGNALTMTPDALDTLEADYIALGDHHRHRPPEEFNGAPACYPGSFAALDLTESGPRGYVLVDLEPGQPPRVQHVPSGIRAVAALDLDVSTCEDDVEVAERAARAVPQDAIPVLRISGEPAFPLDADAITAELRERYGHALVVDDTRYFASQRLEELSGQDTVAGHVVRLGRERIAAAATPEDQEVAQRALRVALRALGVE